MKTELLRELERIGWEELYGRHIPVTGSPNAKGEIRLISPFPYLNDHRPSFSININTGVWHCFIQGRGGDYVMFRSLMETSDFDPISGYGIPDYERTQRQLLREFGIAKPIDPNWIKECQSHLLTDPTLVWSIQQRKPWDLGTMLDLGVGFDSFSDRLVIPIHDRKGDLVNAKLYLPGASDTPKMIWAASGLGGNYLFPQRGWTEPWVILVEGETDVISLRCVGFPAVSGTAGAGDPVPEGDWWRGKHVFVLTDGDAAGLEATEKAIYRLRELAQSVTRCSLPEWEGKSDKPDVSDYIQYLRRNGHDSQAIQSFVTSILEKGERLDSSNSELDAEAKDVTFAQALSGQHLNTKVRFKARVLARSTNRYVLPTDYEIRCPGGGQQWCKRCPMSDVHRGIGRFRHDPRKSDTLKLIQCTTLQQIHEVKIINGIAKACQEPVLNAFKSRDVEVCMIGESTHEASTGVHERARREAFFLLSQSIEENRDYEIEAYVYAHPKSQQAVFLVTGYRALSNAFEGYQVDASSFELMSIFKTADGQSSYDKLLDVADDLAESTTLIKGRIDLHLAYRSVFHSVLAFNIGGEHVKRGWLEALVIGDTRCGKSKTFQQLANFYDTGTLVDCKMQSVPGVLGSVQQSNSGEFFVLAGLLPQNDGGIVCFDEFVTRGKDSDFIGALSSTRAEGVVRINKAASGEFKARVRSIWLANPGQGELMAELPDKGCELIPRIIRQPEDIARFDFAITVSQLEVPVGVVNQIHAVPLPRYPKEASQELLRWVYSRRSDQIVFEPSALDYLISVSAWLAEKYDPSIPIVEINDQKTRVAKLAVSVAAQCFSTIDGETLVVSAEHVATAARLLCLWFDKPSMAYDAYSSSIRREKDIRSPEDLWETFSTTIHPYGKRLAEILLRIDEIDPRSVRHYVPISTMYADQLVGKLNACNCLKASERGRKGTYRKTPDFTRWLKEYLERVS